MAGVVNAEDTRLDVDLEDAGVTGSAICCNVGHDGKHSGHEVFVNLLMSLVKNPCNAHAAKQGCAMTTPPCVFSGTGPSRLLKDGAGKVVFEIMGRYREQKRTDDKHWTIPDGVLDFSDR